MEETPLRASRAAGSIVALWELALARFVAPKLVHAGPGTISDLGAASTPPGRKVLAVTGASSARAASSPGAHPFRTEKKRVVDLLEKLCD